MEDKNDKYNNGEELSKENFDDLLKIELGSKSENVNKEVSKREIKEEPKIKIESNKSEIENKEVSKTEIKEEPKIKIESTKSEIENKEVSKTEIKEQPKIKIESIKSEIENKEVSKTEIKEELNIKSTKPEIENKEVSKTEIKEELNIKSTKPEIKEELKPKTKDKVLENKTIENKLINNLENKNNTIEKSNQTNKDALDVKTKIKPKKEIPLEKKPFSEFINEHLIPEIKNEFKNRGKVINTINIEKTNRPISEDICWVIYCEVHETCNFWLSFERDDITSPKSFSLCKNYEKPSIIESFLIDEKKITLKLIISRILQRLNGQKLIGAN